MNRALLLILPLLLASGCASVNIQRGKDLSTAGLSYTKATTAVVDATIDAMIDADSEAQVRSFEGQNAPKPNPAHLERLNALLIKDTASFLKMKASLGAVEAYFSGLQALANDDSSAGAATAVGQLADHVNSLNKVLENDPKAKDKISADQKTALTGLTKLVVDQVHGAKVAEALRRDAPVIGEALAYQSAILDDSARIIGDGLKEKANVFYVDHVRAPYASGKIGASWVDDRRAYIRGAATGEVADSLKTAREASKQMTKTWEKVLSGTYDLSEMKTSIEELNDLLAATDALRKAPGPKAAAPATN